MRQAVRRKLQRCETKLSCTVNTQPWGNENRALRTRLQVEKANKHCTFKQQEQLKGWSGDRRGNKSKSLQLLSVGHNEDLTKLTLLSYRKSTGRSLPAYTGSRYLHTHSCSHVTPLRKIIQLLRKLKIWNSQVNWWELETCTLNKVTKVQKDKYCIFSLISGYYFWIFTHT